MFASPKLFITTHTLSTHITSHTLYNKYKLLKIVFAQLFLKVYNNILSIVKCELMIMSASCWPWRCLTWLSTRLAIMKLKVFEMECDCANIMSSSKQQWWQQLLCRSGRRAEYYKKMIKESVARLVWWWDIVHELSISLFVLLIINSVGG